MSKRNLIWLIVIVAIAAIVWVVAGWLFGLIAGGVTLVASEVVERAARRQRRAEGDAA